jgi:hypothetical protein
MSWLDGCRARNFAAALRSPRAMAYELAQITVIAKRQGR